MTQLSDFKILEKYLSPEELKEIAKEVATKELERTFGQSNPHRESNFEFYVKHGAYEAVRKYAEDFDTEKHAADLNKRVGQIIRSMEYYSLPDTYQKMIEESIENNRGRIEFKIHQLITRLVNDKDQWPNVYTTFEQHLGGMLGDMMYALIEKHFKGEEK